MMKRNHTPLTASAALAAALAFAPTQLLAQAVEIPTDQVIIAPQTPPPVVEPTIVAPPEAPVTAPPPTMASTPPARPAATTTTTRSTTTPTTTRTTVTRTTSPRAAAPAPAPRVSAAAPAPAPAAADAAPAPVVDEVPVEPVAAPVATNDTDAAPTADNDNGNSVLFGLMVIAAIAALVLAIWGFIAIGRRRPFARRSATRVEPVVERPTIRHPAPIHAETMPEPEPETTSFAAPVTPTPINTVAPAPSMAHTGASVPLPRSMPATFEERDALMRKMIAAKPDRANPFTSPIQRYHRAKLIMQSLGRDFGDAEPWIDLSQYPQNWPELARRQHAA